MDPGARSDSDPRPTSRLVEGYLSGELEEEWVLFVRFEAELLQVARQHAVARALTLRINPEDLVHDLWVRCLRRKLLSRYEARGRGSLGAYLRKALDREIRDQARSGETNCRKVNEIAVSLDRGLEEGGSGWDQPSTDPTPSQEVRNGEEEEQIEHLLDNLLNKVERLVWHQRVGEGLSFAKIGLHIGRSEAGARSIFLRARRKLMEHYVHKDGEFEDA